MASGSTESTSTTSSVTSSVDWSARGFEDVTFIEDVCVDSQSNTDARVSALALWTPVQDSPYAVTEDTAFTKELLNSNSAEELWPRRVKFRMCPWSNQAGIEQFKRNASIQQIIAAPNNDSDASFSQSLAVSTSAPKSSPVLYPYFQRMLAFWEDSVGLWGVTDESPTVEHVEIENAGLEDYFKSIVHHTANVGLSPEARSKKVWGRVAELLIRLAEILLALHEKNVLLTVCRPEFFVVKMFKETLKNESNQGTFVDLMRLTTALQLPTIANTSPRQSSTSLPHRTSSSTSLKSLKNLSIQPTTFSSHTQSSIESWEENYARSSLANHFRFIAPELLAAVTNPTSTPPSEPSVPFSSGALAPPIDVFSWAVLAYELISGEVTESLGPSSPSKTMYGASQAQEIDPLSDYHSHLTLEITPLYLKVNNLSGSSVNSALSTAASTPISSNHSSPRPSVSLAHSHSLPHLPIQLSNIIMKSLSKSAESRYVSFQSLLHDLKTFERICRTPGATFEKFLVGEVDNLCRFEVPTELIERSSELKTLDTAFSELSSGGSTRHGFSAVTVFGTSGSGKSKLVETWANELETRNQGKAAFVGFAKLDQHLFKPLSGYIQCIQSLLSRVFSDAKQDHQVWRSKILTAFGTQAGLFSSLISSEWTRALFGENEVDVPIPERIDWDNFLAGFEIVAKRCIQVFAKDRPLVLILDDCQWLAEEEVRLWQSILGTGFPRLDNVMVVSLYRTSELIRPPSQIEICPTSRHIPVAPFDERSVSLFLGKCFKWSDEDLQSNYLVSFVNSQTLGSPFFVRSLVTSLVREKVIYFNFDVLHWMYNIQLLQHHISAGLDQYLQRVFQSLSPDVQHLLQILSCLPSTGISIDLLCLITAEERHDVERMLHLASLSGGIVINGEIVRFSHDRQRQAAYSSLSEDLIGQTHFEVARSLHHPHYVNEYIFDVVDNYLLSRKHGIAFVNKTEFASLALQAAERASSSASFQVALSYLTAADSVLQYSDVETWKTNRASCFLYSKLFAESSAVLKIADPALEKIRSFIGFCRNTLEELTLRTLIIRLLTRADLTQVYPECETAIIRCGFQIDSTSQWAPETAEDFQILEQRLEEPSEESSEDLLLRSLTLLLSYAGPSLFVSRLDHSKVLLRFAVAMGIKSTLLLNSETTAYLLSVYSLSVADEMPLELTRAYCDFALRLQHNFKEGYFSSATMICCLVQSHKWTPIKNIRFEKAFEAALRSANWDAGGYIMCMDFSTSLLSTKPLSSYLARIKESYTSVTSINSAGRVFLEMSLQAIENIYASDENDDHFSNLYKLEGAFIRPRKDFEIVKDYPLHSLCFVVCSLHLGVSFGAPAKHLLDLVNLGRKYDTGATGMIFRPEWVFLESVVLLLHGGTDEQIKVSQNLAELKTYTTVDYKMRYSVLASLSEMRNVTSNAPSRRHWSTAIDVVERAIKVATQDHFPFFGGLISFYTARFLSDVVGKDCCVTTAYARNAYNMYAAAEATALCRLCTKLFPGCSDAITTPKQSVVLSVILPGVHSSVRSLPEDAMDVSTPSGSSFDEDNEIVSLPSTSAPTDGLDKITLLRSALVIAGERDPSVIMIKMLRILLQFTRSDFAAIAMVEDEGSSVLRLKGAGSYQDLTMLDLPLSQAERIAPVSLILHVSRTRQPLINSHHLSKLRPDPFFGSRTPRSIMVLPFNNQGTFAGVIVLASKNMERTLKEAQVLEVVTSLATFLAVGVSSSNTRRSLEKTVERRTQELESALAAKTSFLSHMSHELRTPLFAVLGLCGVLEDSTELTSVQREYLSMIKTSGEDLQTIIASILDLSKLQSNQVQPEKIVFSLREVIDLAMDSVALQASRKNLDLVFSTAIPDCPPPLIGDPFRIKQILMNFLSNAVKFSPKGYVAITCQKIGSGTAEDPYRIVVNTQDEGLGIPQEKMNTLFKSFSQVDSSISRSYGGSGLGLAINLSLSRLLGGDAWAVSRLGKGSTFSFSFLYEEAKDAEVEIYPPIRGYSRAFNLILPGRFATVLAKNLEHFGLTQVDIATSVEKATDPRESHNLVNAQYHIILVNVPVDEISYAMLQKLQPNAEIILMVSMTELASTIARLQIRHVARPVKAGVLYHTLSAAAQRSQRTVETGHREPPPPEQEALKEAIQSVTSEEKEKKTKKSAVDKELAKVCPLNILLVDDNSLNLIVGTKILSRFGYTCTTAENGREAVIAAEATPYDLILMDLSMPVLNGYQAYVQIQKSPLAGSPVVVALTANTEKQENHGFFDYLTKPLNVASLAKVLKDAFEKRSEMRNLTEVKEEMEEKYRDE